MTVTSKSAGSSLLSIDSGAFNGFIKAAMPNAIPTLNRLEPNAFPMASSGFFCIAATAEEKISGAEVPKATIVRPISSGETPRFLAKPDAPETNLSAPQISPRNPSTIMTEAMSISSEGGYLS